MRTSTGRRVAGAAIAVALLTALAVVLVGRGGDGTRRAAAELPHTTATTTPGSGSPSTAKSAEAPRPRTVLVGPVVLTVPPGWTTTTRIFGDVCIEPRRERPHVGGCSGLEANYGWDGYLPGNEMGSFSRESPGWYHATDVQPCPVDPSGGDSYNGIDDAGRPPVGGEQLRPVGDRRAYYYRWTAGCQKSTYRFSPRAWYLPVSKVLMFDYIGYPDVDPIVASARFDNGSWQVGFVRDVHTDGAIDFDDLDWRAAQEDFQPPKVHDPDSAPTPFRVAPGAIVESVHLRDGGWFYERRTLDWLRAFVDRHPQVAFHVHVTSHGVVDQVIQEVTLPTVH